MLPRRNRLHRPAEVQRVRQLGQAWRHPLAILLTCPAAGDGPAISGEHEATPPARFAFVASRRVGNAVARNRAKRLLREAVRQNLGELTPGWNCVVIARQNTPAASFTEVEAAVRQLLSRARLMPHRSPAPPVREEEST